jgi:uncharacterized protein YifN (PemK superfamily)
MKKIIPSVAFALTVMATTFSTQAQTVRSMPERSELNSETSPTLVHTTTPETKDVHKISNDVSVKAARHFVTTYPAVSSERWSVLKNGYMATFTSNSINTKVFYDASGTWLHSIERYTETRLPKHVRASVKRIYYDYTITAIDEVNIAGSNAKPRYVVYLKDDNTFKTIIVCDGEVEEMSM